MTRKTRILAAIVLSLLIPMTANAWVAVGVGPRFVGAAAVGVAAGVVVGSAVAASSQPQTVVVQPPPAAAVPAPPAVGSVVTVLPSGCASVGGRYQCGSVWYQPYFGGNGVYYQVVMP
jgi:hypothetical protein